MKKIRLKKNQKSIFFRTKLKNVFFLNFCFVHFFTLKSLPKIWIFFLNFFWHLKNMNSLQNSFWAVQDQFWAQNYFKGFKRTNATTEIVFWFSDILTDFHPHLKKKNRILGFWPKISSNFEISDVNIWPEIWPIGQKCRLKHWLVPYSYQNNFEQNPMITKELNVKKPCPPPNVFGGGLGFYWSLIPVTI